MKTLRSVTCSSLLYFSIVKCLKLYLEPVYDHSNDDAVVGIFLHRDYDLEKLTLSDYKNCKELEIMYTSKEIPIRNLNLTNSKN